VCVFVSCVCVCLCVCRRCSHAEASPQTASRALCPGIYMEQLPSPSRCHLSFSFAGLGMPRVRRSARREASQGVSVERGQDDSCGLGVL
jgi:hypothetical protein